MASCIDRQLDRLHRSYWATRSVYSSHHQTLNSLPNNDNFLYLTERFFIWFGVRSGPLTRFGQQSQERITIWQTIPLIGSVLFECLFLALAYYSGDQGTLTVLGDPYRQVQDVKGHRILLILIAICLAPCIPVYGINLMNKQNREHYFKTITFLFTRDRRHLIPPITHRESLILYRISHRTFCLMLILTPGFMLFMWTVHLWLIAPDLHLGAQNFVSAFIMLFLIFPSGLYVAYVTCFTIVVMLLLEAWMYHKRFQSLQRDFKMRLTTLQRRQDRDCYHVRFDPRFLNQWTELHQDIRHHQDIAMHFQKFVKEWGKFAFIPFLATIPLLCLALHTMIHLNSSLEIRSIAITAVVVVIFGIWLPTFYVTCKFYRTLQKYWKDLNYFIARLGVGHPDQVRTLYELWDISRALESRQIALHCMSVFEFSPSFAVKFMIEFGMYYILLESHV